MTKLCMGPIVVDQTWKIPDYFLKVIACLIVKHYVKYICKNLSQTKLRITCCNTEIDNRHILFKHNLGQSLVVHEPT